MTRLLVSIDPGETSGIVTLRFDGTLLSFGALDPSRTLGMLRELLKQEMVGDVVYEQFRLYAGVVGASKSFSDLPEVRIIGALEALCEAYGIKPATVPAGVYKSATAQWKSPEGIAGTHQRDAWRLGMWYHIVRLGRQATLTLKNGRVFKMNVQETYEHKEITNG